MSAAPRFRFAPSPTGFLHVGNARAALFNWLEARRVGGEFLLRVEDTDRERSHSDLVTNILDSLRWLGLDWDGDIVFQAENLTAHTEAAMRLLHEGKAYYCDCTGEQIQGRNKSGGYDGHCRDRGLTRSSDTALRFRAPDEGEIGFTDLVRGEVTFDLATIEDFVLLRSNEMPVFLLSNALDDAAMGITHVVRGEDHVNGTPKYLLVRDALSLGRPEVFAHLPLLVNEQRKKLSKRKDAVSVDDFRQQGYLPDAMRNYLALLGWGPKDDTEIRPIEEIVDLFRLDDVQGSPAFFDLKKLEHFNAEYIRSLDPAQFVVEVTPFLADPERSLPVIERLAPMLQLRARTLADVEDTISFLYVDEPTIDENARAKVLKDPAQAAEILDGFIAEFDDVDWTVDALLDIANGLADRLELKKRGMVQGPLRLAVTGTNAGPPLFEPLELLGREETLRRITRLRAELG